MAMSGLSYTSLPLKNGPSNVNLVGFIYIILELGKGMVAEV